MIRSNPADRVERPRKEKFKSEVYKAEELEQLFTAIQGDPAEFGVIMAAFYGLRRSEIKCRSCRTKKESPHFLSGIPYGLANGAVHVSGAFFGRAVLFDPLTRRR